MKICPISRRFIGRNLKDSWLSLIAVLSVNEATIVFGKEVD